MIARAEHVPYITQGAKRAVIAIAVLMLIFGGAIGFATNQAITASDEAKDAVRGVRAETRARESFDARRTYDICIEANERDARKLAGIMQLLEPFMASPSYLRTVFILADAFGPRDCEARLKEVQTGP